MFYIQFIFWAILHNCMFYNRDKKYVSEFLVLFKLGVWKSILIVDGPTIYNSTFFGFSSFKLFLEDYANWSQSSLTFDVQYKLTSKVKAPLGPKPNFITSEEKIGSTIWAGKRY